MKTPTDKELQAISDDYEKSILHLKKLGLLQLVDGGSCIRATDKGITFLKLNGEFDKSGCVNEQTIRNPQR